MTNDNLRQELVRVFELLAGRYGAEWSAKWGTLSLARVIDAWHVELARFNGSAQYTGAIMDEAMRHLPERAPNAITFRHLCEAAHEVIRRPAVPAASLPVRGPTFEERAKLKELRDRLAKGTLFARPGPDWAYRIVERHQRGEAVAFATLRIAVEVVAAQEKRRSAPVADAFDAHPSAMLADDDETLLALPSE